MASENYAPPKSTYDETLADTDHITGNFDKSKEFTKL